MSDRDLRRISKGLALILRHEAKALGLATDPEGFVEIERVIEALRAKGIAADAADLACVIETVDVHKKRYSIVDGFIRANYGHSLEGRIEHPVAIPPPFLYHGTHAGAVAKILAEGLRPMNRQFVHLTPDESLARQVGGRHGAPVVLRVNTREASELGIAFGRANEFFWLALHVPAACIVAPS